MAWNPMYPVNFTPSGDSVSEAIEKYKSELSEIYTKLSRVRTFDSGTTPPSDAWAGCLWVDSTDTTSPILKMFDGAEWQSAFDVKSLKDSVDEAIERIDAAIGRIDGIEAAIDEKLELYLLKSSLDSFIKNSPYVVHPKQIRIGCEPIGRIGRTSSKYIHFIPVFDYGSSVSVVATLFDSHPRGASHPVVVSSVSAYGFTASCYAELLNDSDGTARTDPMVLYIACCDSGIYSPR